MTKITIDSTLLEQISKELDALKRRGVFGDFTGVADALKAAMAEPQDPDSWGAGYEAGYAAGVAEHPAQPVQYHFPDATKMVQEPVQQALCEADRIMGHDDEATEWRERWGHLFTAPAAAEPGQDRLEHLRAFCKWERVNSPHPEGLPHVAEWAVMEIDRLRAAKAQPQEPVQEPDNGGKTGWPPGLLQDDCRGLSKWLASRPDARQRLREALAEQAQDTDCHAQGICQRSGYSIAQRKPLTETSAERTLKRMGYTDCGGELWKPPLGAPDQPSLLPDAETAWRLWGEVQP